MITIKKILVPTDLTDASVPAVGYAMSLAKKYGSEVAVLHVFPVKEMQNRFSDRYVVDGLVASTEAPRGGPLDLDNILQGKMRLVGDFIEKNIALEVMRGVTFYPIVRFGKTISEVVAAAKEEQADLIVLTSQRSGLARLFRGSFTDQIARRAPCPVIMIQSNVEVRTEQNERVPVRFIDRWAA